MLPPWSACSVSYEGTIIIHLQQVSLKSLILAVVSFSINVTSVNILSFSRIGSVHCSLLSNLGNYAW